MAATMLTQCAVTTRSALPSFGEGRAPEVSRNSQNGARSALPTSLRATGLSCREAQTSLLRSRSASFAAAPRSAGASLVRAAVDVEQLKGAKEAVVELLKSKQCNPILIRLGWHDAGTYDKSIPDWPTCGGANGSLRFQKESSHAANNGLTNAVKLLEPIKEKFPAVTYADLFQLASATAIEVAGGPKIPMKYGRVDARDENDCHPEGNLPDAAPPSPADHLRKVFNRMGLEDKEIVALSGAHTLGRSYPSRSGFGKESTKYTENGPGTKGGQSWTVEWLKFDNSYFKDIKAKTDEELLVLPTDAALFEDPGFKVYAEKYAADQEAFFADYAESHKKLSEQGAKFDPPEGVVIDDAPKKFRAAEYSSGKSELSAEMKEKMRKEYLAFGGSPNQPLQSNYFLNIIIAISVLVILTKLVGGI
eukprot:TRINITY_DN288_c0_g1_i1.p1 TRINITY_DN288_c0_g1~~TRINITY_DN288_c0_g1_i1.p1  ORF type:complete len:420 (+),score=99.44 TRINITY_DN288_c0_g1_i1:61-1320(+)